MGVGVLSGEKVVVEVEVPQGVDREEYLREVNRVLEALKLRMLLDRAQRRVPSQEEVEELAREAKRRIRRRVEESLGRQG